MHFQMAWTLPEDYKVNEKHNIRLSLKHVNLSE